MLIGPPHDRFALPALFPEFYLTDHRDGHNLIDFAFGCSDRID